MAGGAKQSGESAGLQRRPALTLLQILLIAAIAGLLLGITVGLVSLLT